MAVHASFVTFTAVKRDFNPFRRVAVSKKQSDKIIIYKL